MKTLSQVWRKFWCVTCGFKTKQQCLPDEQSVKEVGLIWRCDVCKGRVERSAHDASLGEEV